MHIVLFVDDKNINLNEFVEEFLGNTLEGAVKSLSGINKDWKKIEIKITK